MSSDSPLTSSTPPKIPLDAREQDLKSLLLDLAAYINSTNPNHEPVVLRWAGGWVRDKLLGRPSHDIDVAINSMTGETFMGHYQRFCEARGMLPGRQFTVASNPDKSKHLETTTMKLCGLDVDFVNLRKETYAEDSRNPQMEFGTPEEDALRRDATINALFYNIHTGEVEDFVGGVEDMKKGLIRTPLDPLQTFKDDPLRVLRLIRFASRLEFKLDSKTSEVMNDKSVLDALEIKISRERVGIELEKMLRGEHPYEALELINDRQLYHTIFTDPDREDMPQPDISHWREVIGTLDALFRGEGPGSLFQELVRDKEDAYHAWVLAALAPWELLPDDLPKKSGKLAEPLATQAARGGFKASNRVSTIITVAHRNRDEIVRLKKVVNLKQDEMSQRDIFGMAIRKWDIPNGPWRLQVLSAIFVDVLKAAASESGLDRANLLGEWKEFMDHLGKGDGKLDVMEVPSIKPLLNGKDIAKALGEKPGKWMSIAVDIAMKWQLRNPEAEATDPAGAIDEIKQHKKELGLG